MPASAKKAAQQWLPQSYLRFERFRLRPALELLARVPALPSAQAPSIVDLGAGTCNMAPAFLYAFLAARRITTPSPPVSNKRMRFPSAASAGQTRA